MPYKCVMYQIISITHLTDNNGVVQGHAITPFLFKVYLKYKFCMGHLNGLQEKIVDGTVLNSTYV